VGPPKRVPARALPRPAGGRHGRQLLWTHPVRRRAPAVPRHAARYLVRPARDCPARAVVRLRVAGRAGPSHVGHDGEVRHHYSTQEPPLCCGHASVTIASLLVHFSFFPSF
jgi:hypothetical protein